MVEENCLQFEEYKFLTNKQRLTLFRAIMTCLYSYVTPVMLEKSIINITIHAAVQAIAKLENPGPDHELIELSVEPSQSKSNLKTRPHHGLSSLLF